MSLFGARPMALLLARRAFRHTKQRLMVRAATSGASRGPRTYLELAKGDPANAPLARDVRLLGAALGDVVRPSMPGVFETVEQLRKAAQVYRDPTNEHSSLEPITRTVEGLSAKQLRDVSNMFSHFLALSNTAETRHRIRILHKQYDSYRAANPFAGGSNKADGALPQRLNSCAGTLDAIKNLDGASLSEAYKALTRQRVELVLTAHPTQVHRRTMLRKQQHVSELLARQDLLEERGGATPYEQVVLENDLRREVSAIWGTDKLRRGRPSPQEEAKGNIAVLEASLWHAVPSFLRKLDAVVSEKCGVALPIDVAPMVFASWMGGDRDGNPHVISVTTREVVATQRRQAAELYMAQLEKLHYELSVLECTDALRELPIVASSNFREPYRVILYHLGDRFAATAAWADQELHDISNRVQTKPSTRKFSSKPIFEVSEFLQLLHLMHESLVASGYPEVASGGLVDLIRRAKAFGLQMAPLDLRQESTRHAAAVDALCKLANIEGYLEWDEVKRIEWLSNELVCGRPLLKRGVLDRLPDLGIDSDVCEVLRTVALIRDLPPGSLGAYVISQATQASDVLAVELLMAETGAVSPLRVVPLFETLDDLQRSASIIDQLFASPGYAERSGKKQEVMVGYSDSAKDAGRIAAMWAQYEAQEQMLAVAQKHGFEIAFFHGKGGTVGRGGNPAVYDGILAHPPGTIDGRFRVTEQGEMITYNFGHVEMAERSIDIYTAAVLRDSFIQRPAPTDEWRGAMAEMSRVSCDAYRSVVRGTPNFVPYFRLATPEQELGDLNVGSRPSKRNPHGGVDTLRAIPWIFAWNQTRLILPSWLGIGEALAGALGEGKGPVNEASLREMYEKWPWFTTSIDLFEVLLAKTEPAIAAHYDEKLVKDPELLEIGKDLRQRLAQTEAAVLKISGNKMLAEENALLIRSLRLSGPYLDCLHVIQAESLKRLRESQDAKEVTLLKDALLITIKGIATGVRSSG